MQKYAILHKAIFIYVDIKQHSIYYMRGVFRNHRNSGKQDNIHGERQATHTLTKNSINSDKESVMKTG